MRAPRGVMYNQISRDKLSSLAIGFVGLGNMGFRMATNLFNHVSELHLHDKFPRKDLLRQFRTTTSQMETGSGKSEPILKLHDQLLGMSSKIDCLITMLPKSEDVVETYTGMGGVFRNFTRPCLFLDCSTISPMVSRHLTEEAREFGHFMVDAPVSGGIKAAESGSLTFMVGMTPIDETLQRANSGGPIPAQKFHRKNCEDSDQYWRELIDSILSTMGHHIFCGRPGTGSAAKVCNNLILASSMLGVSEAYSMAELLGVDLEIFNKVVNQSSGKCWVTECYNPVPGLCNVDVPSNSEYQKGFSVDLMRKDISLFQECASACEFHCDSANTCQTSYARWSAAGNGHLDFSSIINSLNPEKKRQS